MRRRHLLLWACCAALAPGLAACGRSGQSTDVSANNNGAYVEAGAVTYQLQVSRELNPFDEEDRGYLAGVSSTSLQPNQLWYVVFLWAKNQTQQPQPTASSFDIIDTRGTQYYPVQIDAQANPYAWQPQTLGPSEQLPALNTTAYYGPTQGEELLFKLNTTVYDDRPLTLEIHAPGASSPSTISLDL